MDFGRFLEQWTVSTFFPPLWNALAAEKEQRNTAEMDFVKEVLVDVNERMVRLEKLVDEDYMMELHWAVNDMDNALYEIDVYEPGSFMRIADRLGVVI